MDFGSLEGAFGGGGGYSAGTATSGNERAGNFSRTIINTESNTGLYIMAAIVFVIVLLMFKK